MTPAVGHTVSIAKAAKHFAVSRQALSKQVKKFEDDDRLTVEKRGNQKFVNLKDLAVLRGESLPALKTQGVGGIGDLKRQQAETDLELARLKLAKQQGALVSIKTLETALVDCGNIVAKNWLDLPQLADELSAAALKGGSDAVRKVLKTITRDGLDTITTEFARVAGADDDGGEG